MSKKCDLTEVTKGRRSDAEDIHHNRHHCFGDGGNRHFLFA